MRAEVAGRGADAVVAVFHLAAQLTGRMRARGRLTVPSAVVITDFAVHRQWLHRGNDLTLCLTPRIARDVGRRLGRPAAVCGPLLPDRFHPHPDGEAYWRQRLAAADGRPPVLLATGAWGWEAAWRRRPGCCPARAFCRSRCAGGTTGCAMRLSKVPDTVALGWVDDMPGLMAAAAALVDNAAGQTALEALAVGLPVIGYRPIPGHGVEGVRAMAALGLTEYAADSWQLVQSLDRITSGDPVRERLTRAGRGLFRGDVVRPLERLAAGAEV